MYRTKGNVKYRIDDEQIIDVATQVFNDLGGDEGFYNLETIREIVKQQMTAEMIAEIEADFKPIQYFGIIGDGVVDDTQGLLDYAYYLKEQGGGNLYLPGGKIYKLNKTLEIPSNTMLSGDGDATQIVMGDNLELSGRRYRMLTDDPMLPYIVNESEAENVIYKDFKLIGNKNTADPNLHLGLAFEEAIHGKAINTTVEHINYFDGTSNRGYNMASFWSENIDIVGGKFQYGGYENVGIEMSKNVNIDRIYSGDAWRTSLQIHQGSQNVKVTNSTIKQTDARAHSAVTTHGRGIGGTSRHHNGDVRDVLFANNNVLMDKVGTGSSPSQGNIQIFGPSGKFNFSDNFIDGVKNGLYIEDGWDIDHAIIKGNTIKAKQGVGINLGSDSIVSDNYVEMESGTAFSNPEEYVVTGSDSSKF